MRKLLIERDDDCDCPRWLRWRVVEEIEMGNLKVRQVVAHAVTRLGARWKRRRF